MAQRADHNELIVEAAARMVYVYGYPMLSVCNTMRVGKYTIMSYGRLKGWARDDEDKAERTQGRDGIREYVRSVSDR